MTRPRVIANFARTVDGKVSTRLRTPARFTSQRDLEYLLRLRSLGDAVIVGRQTLVTDSMSLTLPGKALQAARLARGLPTQPLRVLISDSGAFDPSLPVFRKRGARRIIFSSEKMPEATRVALAPLADIHLTPGDRVDLPAALATLRGRYAVRALICEGGATLFRSLIEHDAVDELRLTIAPLIFGGAGVPTLTGIQPDFLPAIVECSLVSMKTLGGECYLRYRILRKKTSRARS